MVGRGVGAGGERGGGRLSLKEPRVGRSSSTQQASVEMDFSVLLLASACLMFACFACVMCVCAFCLVNQVYRDHVKGWSAMAVTRLFSFFVVFFLFFHLYFTRVFFVSLSSPGLKPPGIRGLGICSESTRARLSEYFQVGYSWLASPLSVRMMQTQPQRAGGGGLRGQPRRRRNFIFTMEREVVGVCFKCMWCVLAI